MLVSGIVRHAPFWQPQQQLVSLVALNCRFLLTLGVKNSHVQEQWQLRRRRAENVHHVGLAANIGCQSVVLFDQIFDDVLLNGGS